MMVEKALSFDDISWSGYLNNSLSFDEILFSKEIGENLEFIPRLSFLWAEDCCRSMRNEK